MTASVNHGYSASSTDFCLTDYFEECKVLPCKLCRGGSSNLVGGRVDIICNTYNLSATPFLQISLSAGQSFGGGGVTPPPQDPPLLCHTVSRAVSTGLHHIVNRAISAAVTTVDRAVSTHCAIEAVYSVYCMPPRSSVCLTGIVDAQTCVCVLVQPGHFGCCIH